MTITTMIRTAAAGVIAAGALSPVALAGGEPKNEWPFTRTVVQRSLAQAQPSQSTEHAEAVGEPKNQWPFTRPVAGPTGSEQVRSAALSRFGKGEAKNVQPFTRPVLTPTVLVRPSGGFDWRDAGIGVVAGLGLALALAGALLLALHRRPRVHKAGAATAG